MVFSFRRFAPAFFCLSLTSIDVYSFDLSGYAGLESRYFISEPLFPEQEEQNGSLTSNVEVYHDFDGNAQRLALTVFGRADSEDSERSHADIRELYWWRNFNDFEVYVGLRKVFWGVTESVHLVDVLNQADNLENIDGEDKLGQPMIELVSAQDWGTLSAYLLPYFREQEFVGQKSRLRPNAVISDNTVYQDKDEEQHIDFALRYSHYIDVWDFGFSHFSGTGRDPVFQLSGVEDGVPVLNAVYRQIDQTGVDVQATMDEWLFKLEAISIYEKSRGRNTALAGGFEYTFFTLGGTNADIGVVMEYQFDDRLGARQSVAQNDLVLGIRWAFNDLDASEVLALVSQDLDKNNRFLSVETSRRLNDKWKIEVEARVFSSIEASTPEYDFRDDDYVQLELRRYF
ncbi:MAG: hypothetical protein K6L80_14625 [Agarilytica sp.]